MLVGIHQPHYLPWLRYIEKLARVDAFIVLDNAQYNKNGWQNRNRIKLGAAPALLTAPVHAGYQQTLDAVRLDNAGDWRRKHRRTLEQAYARAPHFARLAPAIAHIYGREWRCLNDLNRAWLEALCALLDIRTPVHYATDLDVPGAATGRLVNLVRAVGGTRYYSGAHALEVYLDAPALEAAGIELVLQQWRAPVYPQGEGPFLADLSIVDMIAHCGPETLPRLMGAP